MKMFRMSMLMLSAALLAGGFATSSLLAQEVAKDADGHGHDDDSMAKAEKKIADAIDKLSAEDQKLATAQRFCPMMPHGRLGAMGTPLKLTIEGKPVFVCCKGCVDDAVGGGAKTVKLAAGLVKANAALSKLPKEERAAVEAQKFCAVNTGSLLGSMGAPLKLWLDGKPVYLCCEGCTAKAQADPAATLAKVEELKAAGHEGHDH
ncbi:MAG: hypothetical protein ABI557_03700 [Aureliella sp.]